MTSSRLRASFVRRCARNFSQMHNFDASTAFHRNHLRRFRRAFGDVRRRDYRRFMTRRESPPRKTPGSALIRVVDVTGCCLRLTAVRSPFIARENVNPTRFRDSSLMGGLRTIRVFSLRDYQWSVTRHDSVRKTHPKVIYLRWRARLGVVSDCL